MSDLQVKGGSLITPTSLPLLPSYGGSVLRGPGSFGHQESLGRRMVCFILEISGIQNPSKVCVLSLHCCLPQFPHEEAHSFTGVSVRS